MQWYAAAGSKQAAAGSKQAASGCCGAACTHLDLAAADDLYFNDVFHRIELPELEVLLVIVARA